MRGEMASSLEKRVANLAEFIYFHIFESVRLNEDMYVFVFFKILCSLNFHTKVDISNGE